MARPKNPVNEGDLKKFLKDCAKTDIPKLRKRLMDIALGNIMDSQCLQNGNVVKKPVPFSVSVDAINAYGKNILAKIEADAKQDTTLKVEMTVTDALKEVEAKKRAEYEKKQQKEQEAKEKGVLAKRVIGG